MTKFACIAYANPNHDSGIEFVQEQTEWNGKWNKDVMYYDILNVPAGLSMKKARKAMNFAMTTWDIEMDLDFHPTWFRKYRTHKPEITVEFKTASEDKEFRERPSVLAYAYFPAQGSVSGKVVFNAEYMWDLMGGNITVGEARRRGYNVKGDPPEHQKVKIYNFIQVLVHEFGHMLGLRHDVSGNRNGHDVMDAFYSGDRYDLSDRDIYRLRLKYKHENFSHWGRYKLFKKWLKAKVRKFKLI